MKNFNIKSKKGFTLIELLVVIGILAVLATIAIPSVAGLIDRANVSADNTNANEMTNAMERFVSEYELFRQDIASGTFDVNNMDAAQGRVYNVTGADSIEDIRALESEAGFNGIRIDLDNKYAQNHATAKAVIENYMKTSSSTFEPKQSDMTYWYNTVTGYTVVAEKDVNTATLQKQLPQEIRYSTSQPASVSEWIDLSCPVIFPDYKITDIFLSTNYVDSDGQVKTVVYIEFTMPNIYYFPEIDYSKFYYLQTNAYVFDESTDVFDMNNARSVTSLDEATKNFNFPKLDKIFSAYRPGKLSDTGEANMSVPRYFRLCYEYEINGQTRYQYSPYVTYIPSELRIYNGSLV